MIELQPSDPTSLWTDYRPTRLVELPDLARLTNVGRVWVKLEGERPLGNFKVLGGMYAGLRALARAREGTAATAVDAALISGEPPPLLCASDGNHGLAVAAAAQRAGAKALIHLPVGVGRDRADRIEALGGEIVWIRGTYDDAVEAAAAAAARGEGLLIPDTSPDPDDTIVRDVMSGYALLTRELVTQFREEVRDRPGHVFVQAGVGGLAAAMAVGLHETLREPRRLLVVEPTSAACVAKALAAGRPERITGDLHTSATMLSCGLASAAALAILRKCDAASVIVEEQQLLHAVEALRAAGGPATTPSGAAGLAGLLHVAAQPELRGRHGLSADSTVLLVATEGRIEGGS